MRLQDYLRQVGDEQAARQFGVKTRTVASWRRGERVPRIERARKIVSRSPVTMEGIYGAAAEQEAV